MRIGRQFGTGCHAMQDAGEIHASGLSRFRIDRTVAQIKHLIRSCPQAFQRQEHALRRWLRLSHVLATDDQGVKAELTAEFGSRVITAAAAASRSSADGIRGGLADMYTLARTQRIYGSAGSSFSPMAARIGGVEMIEVRAGRGGEQC